MFFTYGRPCCLWRVRVENIRLSIRRLWNAPEPVAKELVRRRKIVDGICSNQDRGIGPSGFILGPDGHGRTRKSAPV